MQLKTVADPYSPILGGRVDEMVASQIGGVWNYHQYDARGHCTLLTDTSGGIREQYDYDAFGIPYFYNAAGTKLFGWQQWGNRFLFTGREWLKELGVYDYRARMYHPELGRFLQPDPKHFAAGDYNLYRYCHNDPVNKMDPLGLAPMFVDQETDSLSHQALDKSLAAMESRQLLGGLLFRHEFSTTVLQSAQGKILSETRTDGLVDKVRPPSREGMRSLTENHNHTSEAKDRVTNSYLSQTDVGRGDKEGTPQYAITPFGERIRYRPSDSPTAEGRAKEGGIIERFRNQGWERDPDANTDLKRPGASRNGY